MNDLERLGLSGEYDWPNVFAYGGKPFKAGTEEVDKSFDLEDVAKIEGSVEGENDGDDWIAWGQLKDGRWFCVNAGCDYTGWG